MTIEKKARHFGKGKGLSTAALMAGCKRNMANEVLLLHKMLRCNIEQGTVYEIHSVLQENNLDMRISSIRKALKSDLFVRLNERGGKAGNSLMFRIADIETLIRKIKPRQHAANFIDFDNRNIYNAKALRTSLLYCFISENPGTFSKWKLARMLGISKYSIRNYCKTLAQFGLEVTQQFVEKTISSMDNFLAENAPIVPTGGGRFISVWCSVKQVMFNAPYCVSAINRYLDEGLNITYKRQKANHYMVVSGV